MDLDFLVGGTEGLKSVFRNTVSNQIKLWMKMVLNSVRLGRRSKKAVRLVIHAPLAYWLQRYVGIGLYRGSDERYKLPSP